MKRAKVPKGRTAPVANASPDAGEDPGPPAATSPGEALTRLMLDIFRVHGALLAAGDVLVAPLGLTSARWQVLGAVHEAKEAATIPAIASAMGLSRQAVLKQVNLLDSEGLLVLQDNPAHRRSPILALTPAGASILRDVRRCQRTWVNALARGRDSDDLERAAAVLSDLTCQLTRDAR